ncbi:type II and III secretion system protein family protein [Thalassoroseus pseudoceratinae]|uniref:type II and III secretion system protein family protein n=1 Tax=Thalassoroseus pseudoceratinae TaxID=2713176 RepID=UPI00142425A7|nr:pilus assembly protein N-terminal domain-containing protein [Thalassoroseus pseudoceratinae]
MVPRIWKRLTACCVTCTASVAGLATNVVAQQPVPPPSLQVEEKVQSLVEEILTTEVELEVQKRRAKILRMKKPIFRTAVADPTIVEIVPFGAREVEFIGKETGSTSVTIWTGTEQEPQLLTILISVTKDDAVADRRQLEYAELEAMINELFPNSRIQLIPVADKVIIRGQARDEEEATQILSMLRQNTGGGNGAGLGNLSPVADGTVAEAFPDAGDLPQANLINMLEVPGEKQVMLKVRIAELKRSAMRQLGSDFNFDVGDFAFNSVLAGGGNLSLSGTFDNDSFSLMLRALETNGSAQILAEPNLVVISGRTATFLAGGEFAVPTTVGIGGVGAATTSFKSFGTQLAFTPTVTDKDRIRLQVAPTFSSINQENSVGGIPGLDSRTVSTVVDMREGQVFAIAGLLQEQQRGDISRIPILGSIPGLNTLFANRSVSRDETELLILVSPELVHPLEPEQAPVILPGMEVTEPNDLDFYWYGDIEGRPNHHHRSTVWPLYRNRLRRCGGVEGVRATEEYYIEGPVGFSP